MCVMMRCAAANGLVLLWAGGVGCAGYLFLYDAACADVAAGVVGRIALIYLYACACGVDKLERLAVACHLGDDAHVAHVARAR